MAPKVEIDVEMVSLNVGPIEAMVLDLVLAKVIFLRPALDETARKKGSEEQQADTLSRTGLHGFLIKPYYKTSGGVDGSIYWEWKCWAHRFRLPDGPFQSNKNCGLNTNTGR